MAHRGWKMYGTVGGAYRTKQAKKILRVQGYDVKAVPHGSRWIEKGHLGARRRIVGKTFILFVKGKAKMPVARAIKKSGINWKRRK